MPWDRTLGLSKRGLTPGADEISALAGTLCDFKAAAWMLKKLSGVDVSESTVRRVAEDAGVRVAAAMAKTSLFVPRETWKWARDARGRRVGYVGGDGIHVPMQGPGGSRAETRVEYVGRLYNHCGGVAAPKQTPGLDTRYVAGFQTLDEMCRQLALHRDSVGGDEVDDWICITDGGAGIAAALQRRFCFTTWILDFWHAKEYLLEFAKTLFPSDDARETWMDSWCHALKHDGGATVLARLKALDQTDWSAAAQEAWTDVTRYYENNLVGMDYPRYIANGWQIGSGPTEAACKTVVGTRLKRSGMRWIVPGAHPISHLRALYLNGETYWNHFWTPSLN